MARNKFETKISTFPAEFGVGEMYCGETAVVTHVPSGHTGVSVGDPAMRGSCNQLVFFTRGLVASDAKDYRLRRMRADESVTISGQ